MVCVSLPNPHFCYPCSDICLSAPPTSFNSLFLTCVCCVFSPTHLFTVRVSQPHPPFAVCVSQLHPPLLLIIVGTLVFISSTHLFAVRVSCLPSPPAFLLLVVLLVFLSPTHLLQYLFLVFLMLPLVFLCYLCFSVPPTSFAVCVSGVLVFLNPSLDPGSE